MFVRDCIWSDPLRSFCDTGHAVFVYLMVYFWFITIFELLNRRPVITSQRLVCYPVEILSQSVFNLTALRSSKINALFTISSLTKAILIKVYQVHGITVCSVILQTICYFGKTLIDRGANLSNP